MATYIPRTQRVLLLGAGMVSAPVVEYLYRFKTIDISVCSHLIDECDSLAIQYPGIHIICLNVTQDTDNLRRLCIEHDVVISLLPYAFHGLIAEHCIDTGTHMVTASYLTDELRNLHERAQKAGVTILNEIGLDPGFDHLLALECIREIQKNGGAIESFISFCGGLPALEYADNPLRYKFSWSPKGALLNLRSPAKYLKNTEIVNVLAGGDLMLSPQELSFLPDIELEGFPNRDSIQYQELYGLGKDLTSLIRGTIRYKGFGTCARILLELGLIDTQTHPLLTDDGLEITWRQLIAGLLGLPHMNAPLESIQNCLQIKFGLQSECIENLGLLEDERVTKLGTPLDTLSYYFSKKLAFGPSETDVVILRHELITRWPSGQKEEKSINLIVHGDANGHSAMARTVGLPVAIATKMILDNQITERGVILPFREDVVTEMLIKLRAEGLKTTEVTKTLQN